MRVSTDRSFFDAVWQTYSSSIEWVYSGADRTREAIYVQYEDAVGNKSEILEAPIILDETAPIVYVEVPRGSTLIRDVQIYSYDELSYPAEMKVTNDPLFLNGVVKKPFADIITWKFDEKRVIWVQVKDAVGNWSEPYPAYADDLEKETADEPIAEEENEGSNDEDDIESTSEPEQSRIIVDSSGIEAKEIVFVKEVEGFLDSELDGAIKLRIGSESSGKVKGQYKSKDGLSDILVTAVKGHDTGFYVMGLTYKISIPSQAKSELLRQYSDIIDSFRVTY